MKFGLCVNCNSLCLIRRPGLDCISHSISISYYINLKQETNKQSVQVIGKIWIKDLVEKKVVKYKGNLREKKISMNHKVPPFYNIVIVLFSLFPRKRERKFV